MLVKSLLVKTKASSPRLGQVMVMALVLSACKGPSVQQDEQFQRQVAEVIRQNPKLVLDVINEHPTEFVASLQKAVHASQGVLEQRRVLAEQKEVELYFDQPLKPEIRADESLRGPADAPITLVEYVDFECPFCSRAFSIVEELRQRFPNQIKVVYKHLPLSFHPHALTAAKYYEALRMQGDALAFKFHDEIFRHQDKIKRGEPFFQQVAKKAGADVARLKRDLSSPKILARIEQDQKEAERFEMQGTPGFILNGVPIKGAYPVEHFVQIIDQLKQKGRLTIASHDPINP